VSLVQYREPARGDDGPAILLVGMPAQDIFTLTPDAAAQILSTLETAGRPDPLTRALRDALAVLRER
jgi:hypothetical protein